MLALPLLLLHLMALPGPALAKAVAEREQFDRLRVGMRAAAIGRENGWQVRQVATKFRNPDHAPASAQEREVIDLFHRQPEITGLWQPATAEQGAGVNYYGRINVEPSCLACHGTKASRPAFVKDKYPDDKAFDFQVGDLRGMYAVFIPEVQQALAETQG
ncbi:Tll0287-like domain-containing protein [Synechococcus sp. BA-132 BA5]|uniref:Tll0287-like domain-containing protein n=1 Tax=Synechococcus sp. BA-132 BA5 TaxID=3110252 RepID=UPI002B2189D3|nr:DUF3365 domain-containing protein [Synechococcus sp. BA-132 BA5]MEA5414209.1 DUF3365 domain-containing protein [Synechococcus sp. BA-132 BA5]